MNMQGTQPKATSLATPTSKKNHSAKGTAGYNVQGTSQLDTEKAGADGYLEFERSVLTLVNSLNLLQTSSRQMGASVGLLSATDHFRRRLKSLLALARTNAASLFPHFVKKQSPFDKTLQIAQSKSKSSSPLEQFPDSLKSLSKSVNQLITFLKDFPECDDEALGGALTTCAVDIDYRIDCLEAYKGQFSSTAVRQYVHDICDDLRVHFERVAGTLKEFVEFRVPTMSSSRTNQGIVNLTTFSIFFSGVTATTAGYTITDDGTKSTAIEIVLFLSALVLSVAAAINSLLGMTWHLASFRSPVHRVPFWITLWLKRSPLVFTVLSVLLFYAALVCHVYASKHRFLFYTILPLTALCTIGIASIAIWFEAERWVHITYDGERWLLDVLREWTIKFQRRTGILWLKSLPQKVVQPMARWHRQRMETRSSLPAPGGDIATSTVPPGLLRNAARRVMILAESIPMTQVATMTYGQSTDVASGDMDENIMEPTTIRSSTPSLKRLTITHAVEHKALVSDLKFSPDGKLLASASWDMTAMIWTASSDANNPMNLICTLPASGHIYQISWSSDASLLLTRTTRTVNIWTTLGENKATIARKHIQQVLWLADTQEFLLVEKTQIDHYTPLGVQDGKIEYIISASHQFEGIQLLDVAVLPDKLHAIVVGNAITDHEELQPMLTRTEKRVMIYEFSTQTIKRQAPLLQDVHNVKMSRNGKLALISYRHVVAPQCWKVEICGHGQKSVLRVHCTYTCKDPVTFSAPARFGGSDDLVIAPTDSGSILIWDCESAMLLYTFLVDSSSGLPMSLAWNQMANDFMMASGTHHGTVQLWNVSYSPTPMIQPMEIRGDLTPARAGPTRTVTPDSKSRLLLLDR